MEEAFAGADIVCPKSWAPFKPRCRSAPTCYGQRRPDGIKALEKRLLAQNAEHKDWTTTRP
jgi:hypothetical protein